MTNTEQKELRKKVAMMLLGKCDDVTLAKFGSLTGLKPLHEWTEPKGFPRQKDMVV